MANERTSVPTPMTYLLHHLVDDAASADPDHVALRHQGTSLSYGDLHARAAQLARALLDDGLVPGERVGIHLVKGLESAIALYGIMMAGGVYVPLDPSAPAARIDFVIRDAGIRRLVTEPRRVGMLQGLVDAGLELTTLFGVSTGPVTTVDWAEIGTREATAPNVATTEQDLCYILYTSGSTGTPKGIMHTHRSALSWADVTASVYGLGPDDVISNYAPLHFDLSTLDYFGGARARATTVIIPEAYTKFPADMARLIEEERMTVFYTVPMALIQLAQPGILDDRDLSALRWVLFGGEPMPIKHLRDVMASLPHATFVNVYGPTEVNGCTHHVIPEIPAEHADPLPIGVPYPNVEAIVIDEDDQPAADGALGELLIRAPTMMRGYWRRSDLNAKAFLTREDHGARPEVFHRTGDLVVRRTDGAFDFHGRRDRQTKVRGYRVELDEVEAVLVDHPAVHEGAVYPLPDDAGSVRIVAEVIVEDGVDADEGTLIAHLRGALPPYAVPTTLRLRETFPRTSSGKIDRRAMQAEATEPQPSTA